MKENLLVTLADKNYIQQAKQLFSSVYWNAGWKGDYMLLAHEIPEKDLKWFRDKGILVKKCKPLYKKNIRDRKVNHPPIVLDKFYLLTLEFKKWKNIIFIDSDIIVRGSLDRLAKLNGFNARNIVRDRVSDLFFHDNNLYKELESNFDLSKFSLNSGVFAFSTDIIKNNSFKEIKNLSDTYREITKNGEEPIFNIYFNNKWNEISIVYDIWPFYFNYFKGIDYKKIDGLCLHFINPYFFEIKSSKKRNFRPWDKENYFYGEWKSNLDKAEMIDLKNIPEGKKWSRLRILRNSMAIYLTPSLRLLLKKIPTVIIYRKICLPVRDFIIYQILPRLKNFPLRLLGLIGLSIKKISPKLYYKLRGKNGTEEKS